MSLKNFRKGLIRLKTPNANQSTNEVLTFRKVERSIRNHCSPVGEDVEEILKDLRLFMSNETWGRLPVYDASEFVTRFISQKISFGTNNNQLKKLRALLFVLDTANELLLTHGKDPLPKDLFHDLELRLPNLTRKS